MALNSTPYPNISRIVAGTAVLFPNDSILLCDTSIAAVSMTLLEIPTGYWQTTWKLYILDNSNNAATNNITINAPSGYKINNANSVVINVSGGGCVVTISSNTTFLGTLNYSTGGGGSSVAASNTGGTIVAACTNFKFDTSNFTVTNPSGTIAGIAVADSGWLDLQGFEFMPIAIRPEYRIIGKMVVFRGNAVVPLSSTIAGTSLLAMTDSGTGAYYVNQPYPYTFTGSSPSNGCDTDNDGSITFNKSNSVFQTAITLDGTYTKGLTICQRVVKTFDSGTGVSLSTILQPFITSAGLLVIGTYKDVEVSPYIPDTTSKGLGLGTLRPIVAKVKNGQFAPDYTAMIDTPTPSNTNSAQTNVSLNADYSISTATNTFLFDLDSSDENEIGGFIINLDGLVAYIA